MARPADMYWIGVGLLVLIAIAWLDATAPGATP